MTAHQAIAVLCLVLAISVSALSAPVKGPKRSLYAVPSEATGIGRASVAETREQTEALPSVVETNVTGVGRRTVNSTTGGSQVLDVASTNVTGIGRTTANQTLTNSTAVPTLPVSGLKRSLLAANTTASSPLMKTKNDTANGTRPAFSNGAPKRALLVVPYEDNQALKRMVSSLVR
ncbi:hypothetical protein V8C86DRAFT_2563831 [Haematococcus lacustris]